MKRNRILLASLVGAFVLATSGTVFAQAISNSAVGGPTQAEAEITLTGIVESAIQLTVAPGASTAFTGGGTQTMPTRATATIDFGTVNTAAPTATGTGLSARTSSVLPSVGGAHFYANVTASVVANGISTATVTLERRDIYVVGGTMIPPANLKYAVAPLPAWTSSTDGTQVPDPGSGAVLCNTLAACTTGVAHQLSVFVPDTQLAGLFSDIVLYVAVGS